MVCRKRSVLIVPFSLDAMRETWNGVVRGTCICASLYAVLFLSHIVAAAKEWSLVFSIVAILLSILTFTVGPSIVLFGNVSTQNEKIQANTLGLIIGALLSIALAWAYSEQVFDAATTIGFVFLSILVHSTHRLMVNRSYGEKMY